MGVLILMAGLSGGCSSAEDPTPTPSGPDASTVFGDGGTSTGDGNLAPVVSIQSPHLGQIFQEGDPVSLTATAIDDRDSPEELSATWYSSIDGELTTMVPNQAGYVTFETPGLSAGNHTLTLSVIDSQSKVSQAHVECVVNGAPAVPVVEITPETPHTSDDLDALLVVPAVDPNRGDDEIYYSYQWYRDDELTDVTIAKVHAQKTARGQIWRVEVRAKDPYGKESLGTAEVEIANERPVCSSAVVLPSSGWTDTDLSCECVEWSDGDPGDGAHNICTFLADGDVLAEGEECALSHDLTEKGMTVTCVLTPHDGTDAGDPVESNTVTIFNSPPTEPSVVMTPDAGNVNTLFFCEVETPSTDPDGDDISYETTWVVNGYENPGTTSNQVVPANLTSDAAGSPARGGDTLHCRSRGLDEEDGSVPGQSNGVVLDNSPPEGGAVLVLPGQASELDTLTCQANGATDPDGDEITWVIDWFANGLLLEGQTSDTLEAGTGTAGDVMTCAATPSDGQVEGATQQSKNQVVIVNAPPTTPVVSLVAPDGYLGTATCVLEVPSEDATEVTYEIVWTVNGELLVGPQWELTANEITACDVLTCQVTASDGVDLTVSEITSLQLPTGEACEDGDLCTSHSCKPEGGCLTNFNEAPCDDGDSCTAEDACNQGVCGGKAKSCDDSNPCTVDSCNTETGCLHAADQQICNDGNPCTVDLCSPSTGACSWVSVADGTGCNADDDGCTLADTCTGGFCLPGEPAPCGEGSGACKQVLCQTTGSDTYTCATILSDETVPCDDGFFCTVEDNCDGLGYCEGGPPRQCDQGLGSCLIGLCDETTNSCELFDREDGTSCDSDANGCTQGDSCIGGLCMAGSEVGCEELDSDCSLGSCVNEGSDLYSCELIAAPAGLPCEDNNYCTTSSACDGLGACAETKALDCDELVGNQCRTGYCDPVTQACVVVKIPDGTPCDDGSPCSQVDTCTNGTCIGSGEVCVEERINVDVETDRQPAIGDLGFGRYVVQWGQSGHEQLVSRLSDRLGGREGEELFIPEASFIPDIFNMGIATHPSGEYLLLSFGGAYKCVQNANTNCTASGRIYGAHYDVNGKLLGVAQLWSLLGDKGNDGSLTSLELGHRVIPVAFDDVSFACVVTTVSTGYLPTDPPTGDVYLYPVAGDLSTGDRVLLLAANELASERFAVSRVTTEDHLQLAWVTADEGELRSRRFDRYGNPLESAWIATAVGVGERITSTDIVTRPDGSIAMAWDIEVDDAEATAGVDTDVYVGLFEEDGTPVLEAPISVNTQTSGLQLLRGIDVFSDGGLVLVFDDSKGDVSGWAVQARRFDPALAPLAPPERVNVIADGDQIMASVRVLGSGEWVVAFRGDDDGVWTRRFYKTGEPAIGALEVQITEDGVGDQMNADAAWWLDRALVVHQGPLEGNGGAEIVGRIYDVSGQSMTSSFRINDNLSGLQTTPSVASGGDQFVVAWAEDPQDGEPVRIRARRVDLQGQPIGDGFDVADGQGEEQSLPRVAMAADGRFGITWVQTGADADQVYARTFDASGEPESEPLEMDGSSGDEQLAPAITFAGDESSLIVVWETAPGGSSKHDIHSRKISITGEVLTDVVELGASEADSAEQVDPTVTIGIDGVALACWQSSLLKGNGAKKGIGCQRFQTADLSLLGAVIEVAPSSTEDTSAPSAAALSSGELVVAFAVDLIDGHDRAVQVQRLTSTGTLTGPRVMVNRTWEGDQSLPRATAMAGAGVPFMVTWQSENPGDDGWDAYLRILKPE